MIEKMLTPGERQVIEVVVTSYCDLHCSNCTELLDLREKRHHMSLANIERALVVLADWVRSPGRADRVVGCFGGNACTRKDFPEVAALWKRYIPKRNAGLWTNNLFGHGDVARECFGYWNFVVHGNDAAAAEMRAAVPMAQVHGIAKGAWHGSILTAIRDFVGKPEGPRDEAEMWSMIAGCDIGTKWSGAIAEKRDGSLGFWHCEVASSMSRLPGMESLEALALPVEPGCWARPIGDFAEQIREACTRCGVPLRLKGHRDHEDTDDVSPTWAHLREAKPRRNLAAIESLVGVPRCEETTDYMGLRSNREDD